MAAEHHPIIRLTLDDFRHLFGGVSLPYTMRSRTRIERTTYKVFANDRKRVCEYDMGYNGHKTVRQCGPYMDPQTASRYILLSEPSMSAGSNGAVLLTSLRAGENRMLEGDENANMVLKVEYNPNSSNDRLDIEFFRGLIVNALRDRCPNFMYTYGYIYTHARLQRSPNDRTKVRVRLTPPEEGGKPMAMLMLEHLDGKSVYAALEHLEIQRVANDEQMSTAMVVLQILVQALLALQIAQDNIKYVHYDLSATNMMLVALATPTWLVYTLEGQEYWLRTMYRVVIIDHARSRVEMASKEAMDKAISLYKLHESVKTMNTIQDDLGIEDEFNPVWDMATMMKSVIAYSPALVRDNRSIMRIYEFVNEQFPDPSPHRITHYGVLAKQSIDGTVKRPLDMVKMLMHTALWNIDHGDDTGSWPVYDYGGDKYGLREHTVRQRPEDAFFPKPARVILDATPITVEEIEWLDGMMQRRGRQKHTPAIIQDIPAEWGAVEDETILKCRLRECNRGNDMCGLCMVHYKKVRAIQGERLMTHDRPEVESPGRAKRPRNDADDFLLSDETL